MDDKHIPKPTESELAILQVLWAKGPCSVREVHEQLDEVKEVGYTTTLKLMQIMAEKGLVVRNTEQRSHIYAAAIAKEDTRRQLLNQFVDRIFGGSASELVMQALGNHEPSRDELDEIKALIAAMEKRKSGDE